jgi:EF hand
MIRHQRLLTATALLCALGAGAALTGPVSAQPLPGGRGPVAFDTMDRNDDGVISAQEFADHRAERQAARAAQGRPMRNAWQAPRFEDWDRDGNGLLTPQELAEGQQARFAARHPGWGPGWGPGYGPGYGPGMGPGWGPGPVSGRPCWRNP